MIRCELGQLSLSLRFSVDLYNILRSNIFQLSLGVTSLRTTPLMASPFLPPLCRRRHAQDGQALLALG